MRKLNYFGGTGFCPWITLEFRYNMHPTGCSCQTSEVNSELSTTPVVEISTTEEGKASPDRVWSETDADTATLSLCQCPRTCCPRKPGTKTKRKNKKSKINGIRNTEFETNGSLFPESNDEPVRNPKCGYLGHCQDDCDHSEEFPCGDGNYDYCDSHGVRESDPNFILGDQMGAELIQYIFEVEPGHSVKIFKDCFLHALKIAVKNHSPLLYTGFFHGVVRYLTSLEKKEQVKTHSCKKQVKTHSCKKQVKTRKKKVKPDQGTSR